MDLEGTPVVRTVIVLFSIFTAREQRPQLNAQAWRMYTCEASEVHCPLLAHIPQLPVGSESCARAKGIARGKRPKN